ncbi:hypothetical protein [Ferrimonas pelagia]|uniref:Uncharacterized protein n=1 Tax=Ferrimonas pelagia TaxID=1177826 RepID=A0ABP9FJZ0_9GAMM
MKWLYLFTSFLFLAACSSTTPVANLNKVTPEFIASEEVYIKNSDYHSLIELYKYQLENGENLHLRIKLVDSYVHAGDIDSALFHMEALPDDSKPINLNFTKAQAFFHNHQLQKAELHLQKELKAFPKNAQAYNLFGVVLAYQGDYVDARRQLNQARSLHFSDITIINNLAMLDILESRFDDAVKRLMPIYDNGLANKKVKTNLLVALAMTNVDHPFTELANEQFKYVDQSQIRHEINRLFSNRESVAP